MAVRNSCAAAVLALLLEGCATPSEVRVNQAQDEPWSCTSFAWLRAADAPESLTEQRVRAAVLQELERKGYSQSENADCKVTYVYETHDRPARGPNVGVGVGGGSGGFGGGIGVRLPLPRRNEHAGQLSIIVIDAKRNAEVWNGSIEASSREPELESEAAAQLVSDVLAKFPDRSGQPAASP